MASVLAERHCRSYDKVFMGGPRAWYCPKCREERKREQSRACKRRKSRGEVREIGSIDACEICGAQIIVRNGNHKFCDRCAPLHLAEIDREQGIEWYRRNAEEVNAKRMRKRNPQCYSSKGERVCKRCGAKMPHDTKFTLYCDKCRRDISNEAHRKLYRRKKEKSQD